MDNSKQENIYGKYMPIYQKKIINLLDIPIIDSMDDEKTFDLDGKMEGFLKLKIEHIITVYVNSINGYVGLDRSLFYYSIHHLLFWYYILESEQTSESDKEFCDFEIRNFFYQTLGNIYSIKEKIIGFVGCEIKKGRPEFEKSALSEVGIKKFKKLLADNKKLVQMINMRNLIIHDCYNLDFQPNKLEIKISKFNFDFTTKTFSKSEDPVFLVNEESILSLYKNVLNLIKEFKNFIRDSNNINIEKMRPKFLSNDGKRYVLTLP